MCALETLKQMTLVVYLYDMTIIVERAWKVTLEKTGLEQNNNKRVALGTSIWDLRNRSVQEAVWDGHKVTEAQITQAFQKAVDLGYDLWDTAAIYGNGATEKLLGQLGTRSRPACRFSTKFTPLGFESSKKLSKSFEQSCERLGEEQMEYYWIHNATNVRKWTRKVIPLMKDGRIRHLGVANHNLAQIKQVVQILEKEGLSLSAVQDHYGLLFHRPEREGIIDWCKDNGVEFWSYFVLEQGVYDGTEDSKMRYVNQQVKLYGGKRSVLTELLTSLFQRLGELSKIYNTTMESLAIAYVVAKGLIPVLELYHPKQLHVIDQALDLCIPEDVWTELEEMEMQYV